MPKHNTHPPMSTPTLTDSHTHAKCPPPYPTPTPTPNTHAQCPTTPQQPITWAWTNYMDMGHLPGRVPITSAGFYSAVNFLYSDVMAPITW